MVYDVETGEICPLRVRSSIAARQLLKKMNLRQGIFSTPGIFLMIRLVRAVQTFTSHASTFTQGDNSGSMPHFRGCCSNTVVIAKAQSLPKTSGVGRGRYGAPSGTARRV